MQYSQEFKSNSEENKYTPEKSKIFHAEEINKNLNKRIKIIGKFLDNYVPDRRMNEQLTFKCVHCYPVNSIFEASLEKYNNTHYSLSSDLSHIVNIKFTRCKSKFNFKIR